MAREHLNFQDLMARAVQQENGCIEWQGYRDEKGYGRARINRKMKSIHRHVAYIFLGEPNEKDHAMHLCDNPPCFNPEHLVWGSSRDNVLDMHSKGRQYKVPSGDKHPNSLFTWDEVREIRAWFSNGMMQKDIAAIKNCNASTISMIVWNKTWKEGTNGNC